MKVWATLMSAVMALSMVSAASLTAFADELEAASPLGAQAGGGRIVYDSVYGVFAGEYAWMEQTVAYDDGSGGERRDTITDLVRADGTVTLHTSTADAERDEIPGEWAEYELNGNTLSRFLILGYVEVKQKSTGKVGLMNLDGTVALPCEYDALEVISNDSSGATGAVFAGATASGVSGHLTLFGDDFSSLGVIDFAVGEGEVPYSMSVSRYGDYIVTYVYVWSSTGGGAHTLIVEKDESSYREARGITRFLDGSNTNGGILIVQLDGQVHYRLPDGTDMAIASSEEVSGGTLYGSFARLYRGRDNSPEFYSLAYQGGKRIVIDEGWQFMGSVKGNALLRPKAGTQPGNDNTFKVIDEDGSVLYTFAAQEASIIEGRYGDFQEGEYVLRVYEEGDLYRLRVYNENGVLVKDLGPVAGGNNGRHASFNLATDYDGAGDQQVVGYYLLENETASGKRVDFDLKFDQTPIYSSASNPVEFANGIPVYSDIEFEYSYQPEYKVTANTITVDDAGNPVKVGGYTLGVAVSGECRGSWLLQWNNVKHGNADVWWATDETGKWGAIDSEGNVKVPFEYESYFDAGHAKANYSQFGAGQSDTDYVLVKKDGVWGFYELESAEPGPEPVPEPEPASTLVDAGTGVKATSAVIAEKSSGGNQVRMGVTRPSDSALSDAAKSAKSAAEAAGSAATYAYDVSLSVVDSSGALVESLTDGFSVELSLPVDAAYNGRTAVVTQVHGGQALPARQAVVVGGAATVTVTQLSEFVVAVSAEEAEYVSMTRLYNQWSGEHHYTSDAGEIAELVSLGWADEGEAWRAPASGEPVYRLYNPYSGDHHYTTDRAEYEGLGAAGWRQEGVGFRSAGEGGTPVYRGFNPYVEIGTHHYTPKADEMESMVAAGWTREGIGWYGLNSVAS